MLPGQTQSDDLTYTTVAGYLGVHTKVVSQLARTNRLVTKRVPGKGRDGAKRIPRPTLAAAIEQWTIQAERTAA